MWWWMAYSSNGSRDPGDHDPPRAYSVMLASEVLAGLKASSLVPGDHVACSILHGDPVGARRLWSHVMPRFTMGTGFLRTRRHGSGDPPTAILYVRRWTRHRRRIMVDLVGVPTRRLLRRPEIPHSRSLASLGPSESESSEIHRPASRPGIDLRQWNRDRLLQPIS